MAPPPHLPVQCSKTMTVQGFGSLLGYLPFLLTLLIGGGIVMCYCMAVAYGHVEAAFPYISDTGTFPPESCVFTLFLNCAAVVLLAIFTLKYLHVVQYNRQCSSAVTRINTAALVIGYVAAFGIMVVGAFQETNVLAVHVLGAMMAFIGGTVYMFLIASLGFRRDVNFGVDERGYAKARLFMAFLSAISFIIMIITTKEAFELWYSEHLNDDRKPQLWNKNDKGYNIHLVATAFEWVMALDLLAFLMTFSQELHIIQLQVVLVRHPLCSILSSPAVSANSQHTTQDVLLDTDNELCES
ncbi:DNA damage-regulated autophagy modulator protein 2-like isoform X2 [Bolinopsis microptera]|uniref:DNA damage-regulated autophagy modulator protein 2-like isoform X2 n=1 Tax=Bolinopsis microptera TaxID=2820187 RepID=UPI00307AD6BE